jgi:hypothetical protein
VGSRECVTCGDVARTEKARAQKAGRR